LDLSALVAETLRLLRNSISRKAVVQTNLAPQLPLVWMNATQVRQIVMNLAINASEALGGLAGTITFTTALEVAASGQSGDGKYVRLTASDTGCGMSEEVTAKIFDPFFSTKSLGRGLGLAAVRGIVRSCGATLQVSSSLGKGSTFEILFSCRQPQSPSAG
jgi:signal transduction histidine kinase